MDEYVETATELKGLFISIKRMQLMKIYNRLFAAKLRNGLKNLVQKLICLDWYLRKKNRAAQRSPGRNYLCHWLLKVAWWSMIQKEDSIFSNHHKSTSCILVLMDSGKMAKLKRSLWSILELLQKTKWHTTNLH